MHKFWLMVCVFVGVSGIALGYDGTSVIPPPDPTDVDDPQSSGPKNPKGPKCVCSTKTYYYVWEGIQAECKETICTPSGCDPTVVEVKCP